MVSGPAHILRAFLFFGLPGFHNVRFQPPARPGTTGIRATNRIHIFYIRNCKAVPRTTSTSFAMKSCRLLSSKNGIVKSSQRMDGWPGLMGHDSGERAIRFAGQKCDRKSIFSQSACLSHPMQDVVGWLCVCYNICVI